MKVDLFITIHSNENPLGKGIYGKYFRIDKKHGVKVLGRGYSSYKNVEKSKLLVDAFLEVEILKKAEKSGFTPQRAKLCIVKYRNKFYPGICMQHFSGLTLYDFDQEMSYRKVKIDKNGKLSSRKKSAYTLKHYREILKNKCKINHLDLHEGNIMITYDKKVKIIDFSPEQVKAKV